MSQMKREVYTLDAYHSQGYIPSRKLDHAYKASEVYFALKDKKYTGFRNFFHVWRISRKPAVTNCDIDVTYGYSYEEPVTYHDEGGSRNTTISRFGDPSFSYKYNTDFQCHPCSIGSYLKKCKKKMICFPDDGEIYLNNKDSKFLMEGFTPARTYNRKTRETHIIQKASNSSSSPQNHRNERRRSRSRVSTSNHDESTRNMRMTPHDPPHPHHHRGMAMGPFYHHPVQPKGLYVGPKAIYPIYQQVPFSSRNYYSFL